MSASVGFVRPDRSLDGNLYKMNLFNPNLFRFFFLRFSSKNCHIHLHVSHPYCSFN